MKSNNNISKKQTKSLHYVYIVYCSLTDEYYFGKHSTNLKNDGYGGSGSELNRRKKEIGNEHFTIILFARFKSEKEAYDHEENLIRHFISDIKCLNRRISTTGSMCDHAAYVYPETGKIVKLHVNDPDVLSGRVINTQKGFGMYKTKNGNGEILRLKTNDPKVLSGEVVGWSKGMTAYRILSTGKCKLLLTDDPLVLSGEAVSPCKNTSAYIVNGKTISLNTNNTDVLSGKIMHINSNKADYILNGKRVKLSADDPLVLSGEAVGWSKGMTSYRILSTGQIKTLSKNDPLVVNGEAVGVRKGIKSNGEPVILNKEMKDYMFSLLNENKNNFKEISILTKIKYNLKRLETRTVRNHIKKYLDTLKQ